MSRKLTTEEWIEKAKVAHGDRYDYTTSNYAGKASKIKIICKEHGEFEQIASDHVNGSHCPSCSKKTMGPKRISKEEIIKRAKDKHGEIYTYHPDTIVDMASKMKITCSQHGDFWQSPSAHCTNGQGCPECKKGGKYNTESFIRKMKKQGSSYDYSKTEYTGSNSKIVVTCERHGDFFPLAFQHGYGIGCPKCAHVGPSSAEYEILEIMGSNTEMSNRTVIAPQELDLVRHDLKLAVEFNGTFFHNTNKRASGYHKNKRLMCEERGYRLISVSEEDWKSRRKQVETIIKNAIGHREKAVNARQCDIVALTSQEAANFLFEHHIQGTANAPYRYGLTHPNEGLVAVMTFRELTPGNYDMVRYATKYNVRGGQSKLFKHASKTLGMITCQSFVDCDYFTGESYKNSGFTLVDDSVVSCKVWHRKVGYMSRQAWWKANIVRTLTKLGLDETIYDPDKTQKQMMSEAGCLIIENSGTKKYMWKKAP